MLWMLAIHIFLLKIEEHERKGKSQTRVECNNKGSLVIFDRSTKHVPVWASDTDIQHTIHEVKQLMRSKHVLEHFRGHHDNYN